MNTTNRAIPLGTYRDKDPLTQQSWIDSFLETAKAPLIGTPEWLQCIPENEQAAARKLVDGATPVCVMPISGNWKVFFENTEFAAGVFADRQSADDYASAWNHKAASRG